MPLAAKQRTMARLARKAAKKQPSQGPPGWGGSGWMGGPVWTDAFQSRRAPSPPELVEGFKSVVWACSALNQNGVVRNRLGLYATTHEGQLKPKRWSCPTRPLRPPVKAMLRKSGVVNQCEGWIQKQARDSEVDEVVEHPLLTTLGTVNDDWDYDSLIRYLVACADIVGWFFVLPEATGAGIGGRSVPDLLWPLLAQYVMPFRTPQGSLTQCYKYFGAEYEPSSLIRGRCISLRDPFGMGYGPTQAAWAYVGLNDQFTSLQENLMTQGGRISGFLTDADPLNPVGQKEGEKAEARINSTWTRGNAGRIPYLSGAFKFNATAWAPRDMAELQISDNALQRIANCFGVPVSLLKTEDVNRANADAGHLQHSKLAIDPRCHLIASSLTKWMRRYGETHNLPGWERLFWAFDNPVTEDAAQNTTVFTTYIDKRVMTPNEVRTELGYEPYDGGDEILVPTTLQPLDRTMNPPEPPPQLVVPHPGFPAKPETNGKPVEPEAVAEEDKKRLPFSAGRRIKFNPNHDERGQFAEGSGEGGGGGRGCGRFSASHPDSGGHEPGTTAHAQTQANALVDHDDPISEIAKDAPEGADPEAIETWINESQQSLDDLSDTHIQENRDTAESHAEESKDQAREHKGEAKELTRDQAREVKEQEAEHKQAEKELARDQKDELTELDKEWNDKKAEFAKDAAKDPSTLSDKYDTDDPADLDNDHHLERGNLIEGHTEDINQLHETHADERVSLQREHAEAISEMKERHVTEAMEMKETHAEALKDLEDGHRDERVDAIADAILEFHSTFLADQGKKAWMRKFNANHDEAGRFSEGGGEGGSGGGTTSETAIQFNNNIPTTEELQDSFPKGPRLNEAIQAATPSKYDSVIVAREDGKVIAIASHWKDADTEKGLEGRYIRIRNIAAAKSGSGDKVFNKILAYAHDRNAGVSLNTLEGSRGYWTKHGFHEGESVSYYLTPKEVSAKISNSASEKALVRKDLKIPHDDNDPDEDNTYGLPNGNPLRKEIKRWFRKIGRDYKRTLAKEAARLLGTSPIIGARVPAWFPEAADYTDPMASAMTPLLSAYWDEAGKLTRARLGLDPEDWRVVDPHTHAMIAGQAHDFCEETLATTDLEIEEAYAALRAELLEGVVAEGETIPELTERVKTVFRDAQTWRAEWIARTEAARAVNSASLESAKQSDVCSGKVWLAASNSCFVAGSKLLAWEDGQVSTVGIESLEEGCFVIGGSGKPCRVRSVTSRWYSGDVVHGPAFIATSDHRFLTIEGWRPIGEYAVQATDTVGKDLIPPESQYVPPALLKIGRLPTVLCGNRRLVMPVFAVAEDDKMSVINQEVNDPSVVQPLTLRSNRWKGLVYDIEVDDDHSFVLACGLIAHNCDECQELAEQTEANPIPLDDPFATGQSDKEAYSDIPNPPLHPGCRCSIQFSLVDEYKEIIDATPLDTYEPGALGPVDVED